MSPPPLNEKVIGEDIHNSFGNRVIKSTTSTQGKVVAVKVREERFFHLAEAEMMQYVKKHAKRMPVPAVLGLYTVEPDLICLVMDFVEGVTLDHAWPRMTLEQRESIKEELLRYLQKMQTLTQRYIGRIGHQPARNIFDRYMPTTIGPFDTLDEFWAWCLEQIPSRLIRLKWRYRIPRIVDDKKLDMMYGQNYFCLMHGDLAARNIIVKDGRIAGLVDWEYSGFWPLWMESVCARVIFTEHEEWWKPELWEICDRLYWVGEERMKLMDLVTDR